MTARGAFGMVLMLALIVSVFTAPMALAHESDHEDGTTTTSAPPSDEAPPSEDPPDDAADDPDAGGEAADVESDEPVVREIVYPVVGASAFDDSFGACRDGCTRDHKGNDIFTYGWKGSPVVAATDGRIISTRVGGRLAGCSVTLQDSEGWRTRYVHLNVDIPGTDTEFTACVAPGIEPGARVTAGTLLGWIGDSGNAEDTVPHLHFEIIDPEGEAIDPHESLRAAHRIEYSIIDAADLATMAAATFDAGVTTAYVLDHDDLFALAAGAIDPIDVPVVPYDVDEPQPALAALRSLAPERIVVLGDATAPVYLDDLRALASIVEYSEIPQPPIVEETVAVDDDDAEATDDEETLDGPPIMHDANLEPSVLTVVAGPRRSVGSQDEAGGGPMLVLHTDDRVRLELGADSSSRPGSDANRDALWWNTSEGWRLSETLDDNPEPTIVLVAGSDLDPWTVSFLTSLGTAPEMPLWHHQPTSRATKSL